MRLGRSVRRGDLLPDHGDHGRADLALETERLEHIPFLLQKRALVRGSDDHVGGAEHVAHLRKKGFRIVQYAERRHLRAKLCKCVLRDLLRTNVCCRIIFDDRYTFNFHR